MLLSHDIKTFMVQPPDVEVKITLLQNKFTEGKNHFISVPTAFDGYGLSRLGDDLS